MVVAVIALALAGSPATDLRVTVWPQGRTGAKRALTVHCPSSAAACRRLAAAPDDLFAPTPPDTACTQVYGGPGEALVTGTFRGRKVWARFARRDGCAIGRWDRVSFLFPK